jgi:hypothetical protein
VSALRALLLIAVPFAAGCDAVPDLYAVGAADATSASDGEGDGADVAADVAADAAADAPAEACTGVSCPACPPNPGECCSNGVACLGNNCAADCSACSACAPGICCSKQGGSPVCRAADAGKCPP